MYRTIISCSVVLNVQNLISCYVVLNQTSLLERTGELGEIRSSHGDGFQAYCVFGSNVT